MAFRSSATISSARGGDVVDVVVLGVEVAARERVEPAGGEGVDEPRRQLGRRPRRVVAEAVADHVRAHEAGADGEDGDAVRLELLGQRLAEAVHGRLAGAVGRRRAARQVGGAARDVDDAPAAALDHPRDHGAAAEVDAEDVDLEDVPPLVGLELPAGVLPDRDPRVVDEEVDRAELLFGSRHHPLDVRADRDVGLDRETAGLGGGRLHLLPRSRRDGDARAGARELERDPAADPAPTAGDERDPAFEVGVRGHPAGILR